jgi:hypothetical protein
VALGVVDLLEAVEVEQSAGFDPALAYALSTREIGVSMCTPVSAKLRR